jgi:hypothetical protein
MARLLKAALLAYPVYWLSQAAMLPWPSIAAAVDAVPIPR